jgi:hypothetical protein
VKSDQARLEQSVSTGGGFSSAKASPAIFANRVETGNNPLNILNSYLGVRVVVFCG